GQRDFLGGSERETPHLPKMDSYAVGEVKLWELARGRRVLTKGHPGAVSAVAFDPAGRTLLSAGARGVVEVWDPKPTPPSTVLNTAIGVESLAFHPDGRRLTITGRDLTGQGKISVWDVLSVRP